MVDVAQAGEKAGYYSGTRCNLFTVVAWPGTQTSTRSDNQASFQGRAGSLSGREAPSSSSKPCTRSTCRGNYLEIGVAQGRSLALSRVPTIAVDPDFRIEHELCCDLKLVRSTSQDFFSRADALHHFEEKSIDLAFIDGSHLFEDALRDFESVEKLSLPTSVIVFDDVLPRCPDEAARNRHTKAWARRRLQGRTSSSNVIDLISFAFLSTQSRPAYCSCWRSILRTSCLPTATIGSSKNSLPRIHRKCRAMFSGVTTSPIHTRFLEQASGATW